MSAWLKNTLAGLGGLLLLSGCARTPAATPALMLRQVARAYLIGTTYDQALIAAREEDARALRGTMNRLEELNATDVSEDLQLDQAEQQVRDAEAIDLRAQKMQNPARSRQIEAYATQDYRAALRWSPDFPSQDPELLNAVGNFLADQGTSPHDFQLATQLTSRALVLLGQTITANQKLGIPQHPWMDQLEQQQAITRNSLAWALYKTQHFNEAETTQRQALAQAKASGLNDEALADLWFHLAEILQAQKRNDEALGDLKEAQRLQPGNWQYRQLLPQKIFPFERP